MQVCMKMIRLRYDLDDRLGNSVVQIARNRRKTGQKKEIGIYGLVKFCKLKFRCKFAGAARKARGASWHVDRSIFIACFHRANTLGTSGIILNYSGRFSPGRAAAHSLEYFHGT